MIIIGNIIALIASLLLVYSGTIKEKRKILYVQSIQMGLFATSNIVLNSIPGAIINFILLISNILCYKDKLGLKEKIIITIISIILTLKFNNIGIIGLLPLVIMVIYIYGL